jgi:cell division GTPase FtsZ
LLQVSQVVASLADPSANIIFGAVVDDAYDGLLAVTIVATGFAMAPAQPSPAAAAAADVAVAAGLESQAAQQGGVHSGGAARPMPVPSPGGAPRQQRW